MAAKEAKRAISDTIHDVSDRLSIAMDQTRFLDMMERVIPLAKFVQNNPAAGLVPKEDLIVKQIISTLDPFLVKNGGPLKVERHSYAPDRANVIITYPGRKTVGQKYISFVGSHLDVVPVDLEDWNFDPFKLKRDGDLLLGRGTTDCLGHVCMVTDFFCRLAELQKANGGTPVTDATVVAVFIASEENGSSVNKGVGVDGLMKRGLLDHLKNGVTLWVDCADFKACMGTAGALSWTMKVTGSKAHSGMPHQGINAIELGSQAIKHIQERFYKDFPAKPEGKPYKFPLSSTMKPTQMRCAPGALNQIPPWVEIQGDIRLTPFYDCHECMRRVDEYVKDLNSSAGMQALPKQGPFSKYDIAATATRPGKVGKVEFRFMDRETPMRGVYCNLKSPGYAALTSAITDVRGACESESLTGSLPIVQDLKEAGFDLQLVGFGMSSTYHRPNEACRLSDMVDATKVLSAFVSKLDAFWVGS